MSLISILEAGRRDFLEAVNDVPPESASTRPGRASWSALECIEHVIAVEERYLDWLTSGKEIEPRRDPGNELRLFTIIRSRLTKVEAPEVFRPNGRFATVGAALAEFNAVRERSIQAVRERGAAIYSIGAPHPHFGDLNGAELIQLVDGHARRHADQIREIAELQVS